MIAAFDHRALEICKDIGAAFAGRNNDVAAPAMRRAAQAMLAVGILEHLDALRHCDQLGNFVIVE